MNEGMENLKQIEKLENKLKQVLEICKADVVYDWDSNMENTPQDEFKAIVKIIEEK